MLVSIVPPRRHGAPASHIQSMRQKIAGASALPTVGRRASVRAPSTSTLSSTRRAPCTTARSSQPARPGSWCTNRAPSRSFALAYEVQDAIKAADLPKMDALKIARLDHDEQMKVAERLNEGAKSYIDAKRLIKREEVHATPALSGKYRVIYADPPWSYGDKAPSYPGVAENHYPTMTLAELCDLPVKDIADENAVLFLWTTSPLLEESFSVINAWGFKYKASFVWDKVKHNMGHYNSVRHEFLLIATKGSCQPENQKLFDSVVSEERTEHSAKPETFRNIIETLYPSASKVELFARKQSEGWSAWGNQS